MITYRGIDDQTVAENFSVSVTMLTMAGTRAIGNLYREFRNEIPLRLNVESNLGTA